MLEGTTLCFMEVGSSLFAAAAAAGTCGEVGGELGDLLSDALGLADRFSGCAPSLSCKNQNSTVSPAVTTEGIWKREARGPPSPSPHRDHFQWRCANQTGAHAQQSEASPGGTNHKVHATALSKQLVISEKIKHKNNGTYKNKYLHILVQTTDIHMQNNRLPVTANSTFKQGSSCTCTLHMQAPANMHYGASHAKNNQTHEDEKHLELIRKTTVFHREKHLPQTVFRGVRVLRHWTEGCLSLQCALGPLGMGDLHGRERACVWGKAEKPFLPHPKMHP